MNTSLYRTVIIILFLTIYSDYFSQSDNFNLQGIWETNSSHFSSISAMNEKSAQEWIGKKAIIKDNLYFEYAKIDDYKEIFKDNYYCNFLKGKENKLVRTDTYISQFKITASDLGLVRDEVLIIHTPCEQTPFSEIIVKSNDEIIIHWDGVFFTMKRIH